MNYESGSNINQTDEGGSKLIDLLLHRASALRLAEPGPTPKQIETILQAAVTAPDHGRIRPWRFIVMQGEGRKRLGELMGETQRALKPEMSEEELEKARGKALRAPVVIALVCQADPA